MADVKVYHCIDFNNENSELFQIDGKETTDNDGVKITKFKKRKGSETTLRQLYADGFRVVDVVKLNNYNEMTVVMILVERS